MSKKIKNELPLNEYDKGMVLYSDGGTGPTNPGHSGYGIHGYLYSKEPTTKGAGNPTQALTAFGYVPKNQISTSGLVEVKPISYINSFGTLSQLATNNAAELVGAHSAFGIANKYNIKELTLITDSKYVVSGSTEWLPKWKEKNFIRSDGSVITNKTDWLILDDKLKTLKDKNIKVNVEWIKGHAGHLGNELADKSATIALEHAKAGIQRVELDESPAQGYWNVKTDRHPLVNNKRMYFSTRKETVEAGKYFLGDHGKDDDFLGKKNTDGNLCYVELNTPDELLELIRQKQIKIAADNEIIISANLTKLFSVSVSQDMFRYGDMALLKKDSRKIDLSYIDGEPVTRGLIPPKLATRAVEGINELKGVLLAYQENDPNIKVTDITQNLFEIDKKGLVKFKNELNPENDKFNVSISYGTDKQYKLDLYFSNDLPNRNNIKKLEKLEPKINVLTWMDSQTSFKYAIVIKTIDAIGIWSSIASNIKFIIDKK